MIGKSTKTFSPLSFVIARNYLPVTCWQKYSIPKVFMDIKIGDNAPARRIVFEVIRSPLECLIGFQPSSFPSETSLCDLVASFSMKFLVFGNIGGSFWVYSVLRCNGVCWVLAL